MKQSSFQFSFKKTPFSEELVDKNKFACFFSCVKFKLQKLNVNLEVVSVILNKILLLSDSCKILNNEQIDNGINLKSKPIMQRNVG